MEALRRTPLTRNCLARGGDAVNGDSQRFPARRGVFSMDKDWKAMERMGVQGLRVPLSNNALPKALVRWYDAQPHVCINFGIWISHCKIAAPWAQQNSWTISTYIYIYITILYSNHFLTHTAMTFASIRKLRTARESVRHCILILSFPGKQRYHLVHLFSTCSLVGKPNQAVIHMGRLRLALCRCLRAPFAFAHQSQTSGP